MIQILQEELQEYDPITICLDILGSHKLLKNHRLSIFWFNFYSDLVQPNLLLLTYQADQY